MYSYNQQQQHNPFQHLDSYFQDQSQYSTDAALTNPAAMEYVPAYAALPQGRSSSMVPGMAVSTPFVMNHLTDRTIHNNQSPGPSHPQPISTPFPLNSPYPPQGGYLPWVSETGVVSPNVGIHPGAFTGLRQRPYVSSTGASLLPNHCYPKKPVSSPPSMIWSASTADAPLPMTRQNSSFGNQPTVNMERLPSHRSQSFYDDCANLGTSAQAQVNIDDPAGKHRDVNLLAIGAHPSLETSRYPVSKAPTASLLELPTSTEMERFDSILSAQSMRSTASASQRRARKAAARVMKNQEAAIAPKPHPISGSKGNRGGLFNRHSRSAANHKRHRRAPRRKVFCTQCRDHPDGFRGYHELRRHTNTKHEVLVIRHVCRDPAQAGIDSDLKLLVPLSDCRPCREGKTYNADYNAAAHLRRIHFNEKPPRAQGKASVPADQKRGGKGGGDEPPMDQLKPWIEAVPVHVDRSGTLSKDDGAMDNEMARVSTNDGMNNINTNNGLDNDGNDHNGDDNIDLDESVHMLPCENNVASLLDEFEKAMARSAGEDSLTSRPPTTSTSPLSQENWALFNSQYYPFNWNQSQNGNEGSHEEFHYYAYAGM